jgi:hypothetical protein
MHLFLEYRIPRANMPRLFCEQGTTFGRANIFSANSNGVLKQVCFARVFLVHIDLYIYLLIFCIKKMSLAPVLHLNDVFAILAVYTSLLAMYTYIATAPIAMTNHLPDANDPKNKRQSSARVIISLYFTMTYAVIIFGVLASGIDFHLYERGEMTLGILDSNPARQWYHIMALISACLAFVMNMFMPWSYRAKEYDLISGKKGDFMQGVYTGVISTENFIGGGVRAGASNLIGKPIKMVTGTNPIDALSVRKQNREYKP